MPEVYPSDADLLALERDEATGVEYIPTGQSPYYLTFRRMLYRLLRSGERANDLRVYQDGQLTVGVRPGRAVVRDQALAFEGSEGVAIEAPSTRYLWLDEAGAVQFASALPTDRTAMIPLAKVVSDEGAILSITDLRGECYLHAPSLQSLGVGPGAATINAALTGMQGSALGAATVSKLHPGELTEAQPTVLAGAAPVDGTVVEVVLSCGANIQSDNAADHVEAIVRVAGLELTTQRPRLRAGDGAGARSTAQGEGTPAVVRADGGAAVSKGDLIHIELTRQAAGAVSAQMSDVAVLVVIRAGAPE